MCSNMKVSELEAYEIGIEAYHYFYAVIIAET